MDGDDEDEGNSGDDRPELIDAIEEQLRSIKKIKAQAEDVKEEEEWKVPKRPLRGANLIRGTQTPLTEAFLNPFGALAANSECEATSVNQASASSELNIHERFMKRMEEASLTASAAPSISSISPIRNKKGEQGKVQSTPQEFRLDNSLDSPPGLEPKKIVTISIDGVGDDIITIKGHVINEAEREIPASIASTPAEVSIGHPMFDFDEEGECRAHQVQHR